MHGLRRQVDTTAGCPLQSWRRSIPVPVAIKRREVRVSSRCYGYRFLVGLPCGVPDQSLGHTTATRRPPGRAVISRADVSESPGSDWEIPAAFQAILAVG